jgi:methylthioribulose-1-phosphate dehydratase
VSFRTACALLAAVGRRFYARNWVLATSGNFSAVVRERPLSLCITRSGAHKGALTARDFLIVGPSGRPAGGLRGDRPGRSRPGAAQSPIGAPSAETLLHLEILRQRHPGAILHTHSVCATILSGRLRAQAGLLLEGWEMLKGLEGVRSHEHREWVPIVENDQDLPRLAASVRAALTEHPAAHGFLISGHGLYTWGRTIADAERHVEVLEFLFDVLMRRGGGGGSGEDREEDLWPL